MHRLPQCKQSLIPFLWFAALWSSSPLHIICSSSSGNSVPSSVRFANWSSFYTTTTVSAAWSHLFIIFIRSPDVPISGTGSGTGSTPWPSTFWRSATNGVVVNLLLDPDNNLNTWWSEMQTDLLKKKAGYKNHRRLNFQSWTEHKRATRWWWRLTY
jgi:hypothetical protein